MSPDDLGATGNRIEGRGEGRGGKGRVKLDTDDAVI